MALALGRLNASLAHAARTYPHPPTGAATEFTLDREPSMFFRLKQSPSGQCLQLLEAYRNARGEPRHRVVVSLGDASLPVAERAAIA